MKKKELNRLTKYCHQEDEVSSMKKTVSELIDSTVQVENDQEAHIIETKANIIT